jgi:uncharacterized repeat protein (TIGR03803 family)
MRAASFRFVLAVVLGLALVAAAHTAQAQTYTVIHNFMGGDDGEEPNYGLTIDASGNLYGTTFGGDTGRGTAYMLSPGNPAWTLTPLYSFTGGTDGAAPYAAVVFGPDGSLYGTTGFGGKQNQQCTTGGSFTGCGTVFNLKNPALHHRGGPSSFWNETVLYDFLGLSDGSTPFGARLIFDAAGNLYGTAFGGGSTNCTNGCGVVYELVSSNGSWPENVLYSFTGGNSDGASPWAGVIFDQSGNLYGTTELGGAYGYGTVYELTPSGSGWTEKVLYNFQNQQDGSKPYAGLIFDQSGNLYGATTAGGTGGGGTVFEMTPSGTGWAFQTLYAFSGGLGQLAGGPTASLVMDSVGNLYGATAGDGAYSFGAVFKLSLSSNGSWTYTSLYDFTGGNDGKIPRSNLVFDKYGNLYGTAGGGPSSPNCGGGGGGCGLVFEISFPMQYVPLPGCRVADTRNPDGEFGGPPIQGGTYRNFAIPDNTNCGIPASASAYSLNVTVVPHGPLGYLTVWPAGQQQPSVSTLNSPDGRVKANAAIVAAGAAEAVSIYATNTTDVVLDIDGYFAPANPSSTLAFYPLTPCRIADTRNANGPLGGPSLQGGVERDFPVQSNPDCVIPSTALAYSFNFTAVPVGGQPLGYLTVWPTGQTQPVVSTLNDLTGTVVANAAIVPAGQPNGEIAVFPSNDTDLVIDVNGYFAPPGQGGLSLYPVVPCRVLDTRQMGNGQPFVGELTVDVVDSACAPPSTARAYVFNASVVPSGPLGYLTLWPDDGSPLPAVATLNAVDGAVTSNMAIVPTNNGSINAYASNLTQLILDISSYFAP